MITLTCTSCRSTLQIDPAFAGGVCRCKHCGAIQTVAAAVGSKSVNKKKSPKTLYKPKRDDAVPSSGLDELAQVISGSGLSSQLTSGRRKQSRLRLMLLVGAVTILLLSFSVAFLARRSSAQPQMGASVPDPAGPTVQPMAAVQSAPVPKPAEVEPNFCGSPITGQVVIYVLDRGNGTADLFSYLKEAAFKSALSLGDQRKFQIIFWSNGSDDAFPTGNPTYATPTNVDSARKALDGVYAHGQTDVATALQKACAASPDQIILATGKGGQLDDAFSLQVMQIRKDRPIRIDTFDIGGVDANAALKSIAQSTGGQARAVSEPELKQAAKD